MHLIIGIKIDSQNNKSLYIALEYVVPPFINKIVKVKKKAANTSKRINDFNQRVGNYLYSRALKAIIFTSLTILILSSMYFVYVDSIGGYDLESLFNSIVYPSFLTFFISFTYFLVSKIIALIKVIGNFMKTRQTKTKDGYLKNQSL